MRKNFIRTKYLTGSHIQIRYLSLLLVSMVVPVVFVCGCLYYLVFTVMAEQLGIPESIAYNLLPVIKKINFILLVGVPPIFLAIIAWGIFLSHRFSGPFERFEKEIKHITEGGHYHKRLHLRKHDDLQPIASEINKMLEKIEAKHK